MSKWQPAWVQPKNQFGRRLATFGEWQASGAHKHRVGRIKLAGAIGIRNLVTGEEWGPITAPDPSYNAQFGAELAFQSDAAGNLYIMVGALGAGGKGATYTFRFDGITWVEA